MKILLTAYCFIQMFHSNLFSRTDKLLKMSKHNISIKWTQFMIYWRLNETFEPLSINRKRDYWHEKKNNQYTLCIAQNLKPYDCVSTDDNVVLNRNGITFLSIVRRNVSFFFFFFLTISHCRKDFSRAYCKKSEIVKRFRKKNLCKLLFVLKINEK